MRHVGAVWLAPGAGGLLFRAAQLVLQQDATTAFVWVSKILIDPFHDIWLYHRTPMHVLRGEIMDPMAPARYG